MFVPAGLAGTCLARRREEEEGGQGLPAMEYTDFMLTAGRTIVIYVVMLATIRVLGKRAVGNLTAFDMLIALIMGDLAGDAIYGDVPFSRALVAVTALAGLHYGNSWLSYRKPRLGEWLEGAPTPIVRAGRTVRPGLRKERMSEQEVQAELRLAGIEDLGEVKLAQVENDGHVSVIREAWAEPLRKADLEQVRPKAPGS
jgi:uncharacterized membrane protein YcaP (DUF421 family)